MFNSTPDDLDMHVIYDVSHNIAKIEVTKFHCMWMDVCLFSFSLFFFSLSLSFSLFFSLSLILSLTYIHTITYAHILHSKCPHGDVCIQEHMVDGKPKTLLVHRKGTHAVDMSVVPRMELVRVFQVPLVRFPLTTLSFLWTISSPVLRSPLPHGVKNIEE